ncbi:MAG TPA: hypothetical protein VGB45_06580 [Abditibacterium sp.]|jgi:uncharacterized membrane protein affecting hemolysin expression
MAVLFFIFIVVPGIVCLMALGALIFGVNATVQSVQEKKFKDDPQSAGRLARQTAFVSLGLLCIFLFFLFLRYWTT